MSATKDWTNLSFSYSKTNTVLTCLYKDGKWGPIQSQSADSLNLTVFSPSLHYGMSCFEGLKAFRGVDGKVRIFRPDENAKRMQSSAGFLGIPCPDEDLFKKMCVQAVQENIDFLPPYELRASLYIRPILITTIPSINLVPQQDGIMFMVITLPVGSYAGKVLDPIKTVIARDYDRAAPNGSGSFKVGGNYACAMYATGVAVKHVAAAEDGEDAEEVVEDAVDEVLDSYDEADETVVDAVETDEAAVVETAPEKSGFQLTPEKKEKIVKAVKKNAPVILAVVATAAVATAMHKSAKNRQKAKVRRSLLDLLY